MWKCGRILLQQHPCLQRAMASRVTTPLPFRPFKCNTIALRDLHRPSLSTPFRGSFLASSPPLLARRRPGSFEEKYNNALQNISSRIQPGAASGGSQMEDITPAVRQHLVKVYTMLASGIGLVGAAAATCIATGFLLPPLIPFIATMGIIVRLSMWNDAPSTRRALFYGAAATIGMSSAPLFAVAAAAKVLAPAFLVTTGVFSGFSLAALYARSGSLLCLQGPLFAGVIVLLLGSLLSIFWPNAALFSFITWGILGVFSLLTAVDTQAMITRAACGVSEPVGDALNLLLNFINIFKSVIMVRRQPVRQCLIRHLL